MHLESVKHRAKCLEFLCYIPKIVYTVPVSLICALIHISFNTSFKLINARRPCDLVACSEAAWKNMDTRIALIIEKRGITIPITKTQ